MQARFGEYLKEARFIATLPMPAIGKMRRCTSEFLQAWRSNHSVVGQP
jgi:hypothetical protein